MRYIAFDVETPNSQNDRMSAIGIAIVENGRIVEDFATLVNPETYFQPFHIRLTGICPDEAAKAPTFPVLWQTLEPVFSSGLLIAHNAPFDMAVLSKCLKKYNILWRTETDYACTVQMGRKCFPRLPDHKLHTLCAHLGIPLNHHQAGSDSRACAALLIHYQKQGLDVEQFRRRYSLDCRKTLR